MWHIIDYYWDQVANAGRRRYEIDRFWKSLSKNESTKLIDFINLTNFIFALCILYFQNVFSSVGRDQAATGDGLDIHHGDDYL